LLGGLIIGAVYLFSKPVPPKTQVKMVPETMISQPDFDYYPANQARNTLAILLHGGSWMVGDAQQLYEVGKYLSEQELSVINLNYRLAPKWQYDAPIQDIAAVIRQVEASKSTYGLTDKYRLVVLGFSAGAHLAAQFCLTESTYAVREADVCIGLAGIYDLDKVINDPDDPLLKGEVGQFLGNASPKEASPRYQVKAGELTKFLLVRGGQDLVISPKQMEEFGAALRAKHVVVEELVVPDKDHLGIFSTIPDGDPVAQKILTFIR